MLRRSKQLQEAAHELTSRAIKPVLTLTASPLAPQSRINHHAITTSTTTTISSTIRQLSSNQLSPDRLADLHLSPWRGDS